jgi:N-acetylglutamate synthase-like GNAT family acetyltransferase
LKAGFTLRLASIRDIPAMLGLNNSYAAQNLMLQRNEFELAGKLHEFVVAYGADTLVGCPVTPQKCDHWRWIAQSEAGGVGLTIVETLPDDAAGTIWNRCSP